MLHGAKVIEVRPHGYNKGRAYQSVSGRLGVFDFTLAAGDDRTDEDLFAALPPDAWSIKVGRAPTQARFCIDTPVHFRRLLTELIEKIEPNLWRAAGGLPRIRLRRTMVVARLDDGRLVIHNAMALADAAMAELETWGTPAFLLVPNGWHRLDARIYKDRYPQLTVLAPAGSRRRVQEVVAVDGDYRDFPSSRSVHLAHLEGAYTGKPQMTPLARLVLLKDKPRLRSHLMALAETPGLVRIILGSRWHHHRESG